MAANLQRCDSVEDDYIDMDVNAFSSFFCNSMNSSSPNNITRELDFEFQMSNHSLEKDSTLTSPADELFYKGKLLPLHIPPRLQMVEKLLESTKDFTFDDFYSTPLATTTAPTPTAASTPFVSCNVSPAESCQVSRELNPEEYFLECSEDMSEFVAENPKKSWTRKLRLMKQSSFALGMKLKASKAYLRSIFGKSGCTDESCTSAAKVVDEGSVSKANHYKQTFNNNNKYTKMEYSRRSNPFGQIQNDRSKTTQNGSVSGRHRRSFSVSMRRQSTKNPIQTPSRSNTSTGFHPMQFLKRSTSTSSEIENSIQGAILHCKQSLQQIHHPGKAASEIGFCSLSASRIGVADDQERAQLFRG